MKTLDVMVLESSPHAADDAVRRLEAAGHRVHRCHEADAAAFPCNALRDPALCPLARGVDVALIVNASAEPEPTIFEEGVGCAVRAQVPLVEDGVVSPSPYAPWLAARVDGDLDDALRRGADAATRALSDAIRRDIAPVLGHATIDAASVDVAVDRDGRDLSVSIYGPVPGELTSRLAIRVADAVRDSGRSYDRLRIAVR